MTSFGSAPSTTDAGADPLSALVFVALGIGALWFGIRSWRGQLPARWARYEHERGPIRSLTGTSRQYQSWSGVSHIGLAMGAAFVTGGLAELARAIFDQSRSWWLFQLGAFVGATLLVAGGLYVLAYFWFGVPDWLRPPCQRGWEIVDGELKLVRPEAFHEHPKFRPWQSSDASPENDPDHSPFDYPGRSIPRGSDDG